MFIFHLIIKKNTYKTRNFGVVKEYDSLKFVKWDYPTFYAVATALVGISSFTTDDVK